MNKTKKWTFVGMILVLTLFLNFNSAYDFSKTWGCSNGLGGCIDYPLYSAQGVKSWFCGLARPVYAFKPESSFRFSEYDFNVISEGTYDCIISITETGYGYYDGAQTNENSDVWLNGDYLGRTEDNLCNSGTVCHDCTNSVTSFSKRFTLGTTGNKIKLESFDSHGLRSVSISCNYVPPACVPSNEVCDGIDNDCDGSVDEGIADIISGIDVGECREEIRRCTDGSFQIIQTEIGPVQEDCDNGLDDDCDGLIDGDDNDCSNIICQEGNTTNYAFINNYCNGADGTEVWNNFSYLLCQSNSWVSLFNQSFNSSCASGCFNGVCLSNPNVSALDIQIVSPTNGMIFTSNFSPYQIKIDTDSNQDVDNWSINNEGYNSFELRDINASQNISYGINNFVVCGTNENGTDCDSVFVVLENGLNQTNHSLFIDIISPENKTYSEIEVLLNIFSNGTEIWYDFNGDNFIYNDSEITFLDSLEGWNNLTAYAINEDGNIVSDYVVFFVDLGSGGDGDGSCENECLACIEPLPDNETIISLGGLNEGAQGISVYLTENEDSDKFSFNLAWFLIIVFVIGIIIIIVLLVIDF